jgi:hypothetical protein
LYFVIAAMSSSEGRTPASDSLLALTINHESHGHVSFGFRVRRWVPERSRPRALASC